MKFIKRFILISIAIFIILSTSSCYANKLKSSFNQLISYSDSKSIGYIANSEIKLISGNPALEKLTTDDYYLKNLSKFDLAAKFKSKTPLSNKEIEKAYKSIIINWKDPQVSRIQDLVNNIHSDFTNKKINLPDEISIILTNGLIEGGKAFTRSNTIILTNKILKTYDNDSLYNLFVHELYHIYSSNNTNKKESLYNLIGYKKCPDYKYPENLKDKIITNPDAPYKNYYTECTYKGKKILCTPLQYSNKNYDLNSALNFLSYKNDGMLVLEISNNTTKIKFENGKPLIIKRNELSDFVDFANDSNSYVYHPEEILAEYFVLLINGDLSTEIMKNFSRIIFTK